MIKKISKDLNKQLEEIGIDMLPQFVEKPCEVCGADNCSGCEECEGCGA